MEVARRSAVSLPGKVNGFVGGIQLVDKMLKCEEIIIFFFYWNSGTIRVSNFDTNISCIPN